MRDRISTPLFDAVPAYMRLRDGQEQRALEALMALLTQELQLVEGDIDQLFDNWFVETCEPWVLPYIAELIGAVPMREIGEDQAGQLRAYVANVLQYRQAKGTAAALEQVMRDVTGWPIIVVEFFRQLTTAENTNHLRGARPVTASVRRADEPQLAHRPFSRALHLPAAGVPSGFSGRFNIPNLGVFIWRQGAQPLFPLLSEPDGYLGGPQPSLLTPDGAVRRFDPLGRDLPLVNLPQPDVEIAERVSPLNVPERLRREVLADELDGMRDGSITSPRWFGDNPVLRVRLDGVEVPVEKLHCCHLGAGRNGSIRQPANAGHVLFDPVLGRLSLHNSDRAKSLETGFATPQGMDIGGGAYDRRASLDSWWGDFFVPGEDLPWIIGVSQRAQMQTDNPDQGGPVVESVRAAVQRWNTLAEKPRRGVIVVLDSGTYDEALTAAGAITLEAGQMLAVVAADWPREKHPDGTRPRPLEAFSPSSARPYLPTRIKIRASASDGEQPTRLVLSGLAFKDLQMDAGEALDRLDILDCTLGYHEGAFAEALRLEGTDNLALTISRSITGRIWLPGIAATLSISDSVLAYGPQPSLGKAKVLHAPQSDLELARSTVMGESLLRTIEAENAIFTGMVEVAHRQQGCVRFSYLPAASQVPRRFRCVSENSGEGGTQLRPAFVSDDFALPGFAMLSPGCSALIGEGADGDLEMGAGNSLKNPARMANLREAMREYAPFGLNSGIHFVNDEAQK